MRKQFFLTVAGILSVLVLILGFENITTSQAFLLLFYETELSMTLVVFLSAFLGFLIGFFAMLYSYEKGREVQMEQAEDEIASAPASTLSDKKEAQLEKETKDVKLDKFDEDDEVLG